MKRLIYIFSAFFIFSQTAVAAGAGGCGSYKDESGHEHAYECETAYINFMDKPSLQRGAATFISYCAGCHSAKFQSYARLSSDLDIPKEVVETRMMFAKNKIGEMMTSNIDPELQKKWFGGAPPDLTMNTRVRGSDWVYTYLLSFYPDESRPWGVNNIVLKDAAMPHVLWNLQEEMKPKDFKKQVADLVNFMTYMAEPNAHARKVWGVYVIIFLLILLIPVYLLNKEFWKDVK